MGFKGVRSCSMVFGWEYGVEECVCVEYRNCYFVSLSVMRAILYCGNLNSFGASSEKWLNLYHSSREGVVKFCNALYQNARDMCMMYAVVKHYHD